MLIDTRCAFCAKPVAGDGIVTLAGASDIQRTWQESLGQCCQSCQTVTCRECSKRGIDIKSIEELPRAKCLKCGETNHSKVSLVVKAFQLPTATEEKSPAAVGIPDWVIGWSAAVIFLLVSGAPFTDGRQAWLAWLGDGGFVALAGAGILGFLAPKFMPKH